MKKFFSILALTFFSFSVKAGVTLIKTPQTDTAEFKQIELDTLNTLSEKGPPAFALEGLLGLFSAEELRAEAALTWSEYEGAQERLLKGAFKATLLETESRPAVSLGILDYGFQYGKQDYNILFAIMSKSFGVWGAPTFGFYSGNPQILKDETGKEVQYGLLFSWLKPLSRENDFVTEWISGMNALGQWTFSMRYHFSDKALLAIGYSIPNNQLLTKNQILLKTELRF